VIDAVRLALTALRSEGVRAPGGLPVVEVEGGSGAFVAIDDLGRPHLLMTLEHDETDAVPSVGIATLDIATRNLEMGGHSVRLLDVTCLFESVAEVFDHFVVAVLEHLEREPTAPTEALAEVLDRWKQFLVPGKAPPGRDKLAAVLGELVVLLDVVQRDPGKRIESWVGPFGGRHDLRRSSTALEVKTTRSHTSRRVTIHGEDQLEAPEGGTLHLHLVRLEEVPDGGRSVASVVDELLSVGVNAEALFSALSAAGIPITELAATAEVLFEVRERLTIPVDDSTPRITPASFVAGARPTGVVDIIYTIDLDQVRARALDDGAYAELISALGAG
jgi:hypothetical protein